MFNLNDTTLYGSDATFEEVYNRLQVRVDNRQILADAFVNCSALRSGLCNHTDRDGEEFFGATGQDIYEALDDMWTSLED